MKVCIVGAGITGLVLSNLIEDSVIFEYGKIGGKIQTKYYGKFFVELGPDAIIFDQKKIEKIEQTLGSIFEKKNFIRYNPTFLYMKNRLYMIPSNFQEFLLTDLLSFFDKIGFIWNFLFRKVRYKGDESLEEFAVHRFGKPFFERIIKPIFETVFGTNSDKLMLHFVYPFVKKFEEGVFYKPTLMFNIEDGFYSLIQKIAQNKTIVNEKVEKLTVREDGIVVNDNYFFDRIVLTGQAHTVSKILENTTFFNDRLIHIRDSLVSNLLTLNYHSSFIYIFILKSKININVNGVIFIDDPFLKSITFFSKKWFDSWDVEILRVFAKEKNEEKVIERLSEFLGTFSYDLNKNMIDCFSVFWENALVDYDQNYLKFFENSKEYLKELEKVGIFIFGNFIGGTNILDRIIFVINNYEKVIQAKKSTHIELC